MKFYISLPVLPFPICFSAALLLGANSSFSVANDIVFEEVIVTGEFRDTPLLKLPTSVSVVDEDALRLRQAKSLEDVLNLAPNVNFSSGASRGRYIQIRGIGERSQFSQPVNASVGVIVDGIDFTGISTGVTTLDTQQVEVFRGPQGTLYGANALAGLIYVKGNSVGDSFEGSIETTQGNYNRQDSKIVISTPLSSSIGWRLAVGQTRSDGYIDNVFLDRDDTNNIDELSIRNVLSFNINDHVTLDLTSYFVDVDNGYDTFSLDNNRTTFSDEPGEDTQETSAHALKLVVDSWDFAQLESTLSYADSELTYGFDEDWSYNGLCDDDGPCIFGDYSSTDNYTRDNKNTTLDTRLVSKNTHGLDWVAGIYYRDQDVSLLREYTFDSDYASNFETTNTAVYGEVALPLNEKLHIDIGLRAETREAKFSDTSGLVQDERDNFIGGKLALNYQYLDNAMAYALLSRGYKAGGVNTEANIDASDRIFDTETMWNWELGHKASWLDNRLQSQVAIFYQQRNDIQAKQSLDINANNTDEDPQFVEFLDNADAGYNYGIEAELIWHVLENITLQSSLGLLETGYDDFINCSHVDRIDIGDVGYDADNLENNCVDMSYRDQAHAPKFQYTLSSTIDFLHYFSMYAQIEGKDEFYFSESHNEQSDAYTLLNLRLSYVRNDVEFALWANNVTDQDVETRGFFFGNDPRDGYTAKTYTQLAAPRTFGITASYSF